MPSVDDRIVRLEFDNASFERKIQTTLGSLAQLDKALKFTGASKGLTDVSTAADKVNFGPMHTAIDGMSAKFLALSTIAVTALANITSKAISTGTQLVKSLSLDQITAGFADYELKIGATQTIMAGTGENIGTVTKYLKELDIYADKTIYNLRDMVGNISKFTNAGVKLPVATKAMIGIANAAALSGANSEEASRAMYNLGQAIGQGTVRLIDWKSVELANMGTVEFKQQLIDSAVAMGTLKKATDGTTTTLKGVKVDTKNFGTTLQEQWLTSEALVKTLERYGDETTAIGKKSWAAAQDVKSFSMMTETLKAGISTGWTDTFDIVIGNLEESKTLFTGLTNAIGGFFGKMADARNELLAGWKFFGGRTTLINALKDAFKSIGTVLKTVGAAFREVFPAMTVQRLVEMTQAFADFVATLRPTPAFLEKLRSIFRGVFAALSIGWEVLKEGVKFIGGLVKSLLSLGGGEVATALSKVGDFIFSLQQALVKGGGIKRFFEALGEAVKVPIEMIGKLKDVIFGLFKGDNVSKAVSKTGDSFGRFGDRFKSVMDYFKQIGGFVEPVINAFEKIGSIIAKIGKAIGGFISNLVKRIGDTLGAGAFDKVLDGLNTALLGGITAILFRFMRTGSIFNVGGGFLDKIGESFEQLTGVLKAMQMKVKAEALMKIALAIGVLTLSVIALSLVDSAALAKALTAMAIGFGQLMAVFAILGGIDTGVLDVAKFTLMAVGMTILSVAMLILAGAAKKLAELSWPDLAKGMLGVTALMGMMIGMSHLMEGQIPGLISMGIGMIALGIAFNILGSAMEKLAKLSWGDIGKGLAVVAGLLLLAGVALYAMPSGLIQIGLGMIALGIGLNILATAITTFADLDWGVIGKGLAGIALALVAISIGMTLMPISLPITAAGLILVGIALKSIVKVMKSIADMSWGEIAKGLVGLAGALVILAAATYAMSGSIGGAIAIGVAAASLLILIEVLEAFADIPFGELLSGIGKMALALGALSLVAIGLAVATPFILLLAAALFVLGASFVVIGGGAFLLGKGFELLAKSGAEGAKALGKALTEIGKAIPAFAKGLALGILDFIAELAKALPQIVTLLGALLGLLADELVKLIPKLGKLITTLIDTIIPIIREKFPEFVTLGFDMLMALLQGIRDNIGEIVSVVSEIIVNFFTALTEEVEPIVDSVYEFVMEVIRQVVDKVYTEAPKDLLKILGSTLLGGFLGGIIEKAAELAAWLGGLGLKVFGWIGNVARTIWTKGKDLIGGLFGGITEKVGIVISWFRTLGTKVFGWIGNVARSIWNKGRDLLSGLWGGIQSFIGTISGWFSRLGSTVFGWIGNVARKLWNKGSDLINGLKEGVTSAWNSVYYWFVNLGGKVFSAVGNIGNKLFNIGRDIIQGLWDGMKDVWNGAKDWLGGLGSSIVKLKGPPKEDKALLVENGTLIMQGLQRGMEEEWTNVASWLGNVDPAAAMNPNVASNMVSVLNSAISSALDQVEGISEFNPTITPVLDLTRVQSDAVKIADIIASSQPLTPSLSIDNANIIASSTKPIEEGAGTTTGSGNVMFEQNIYAPEQLSTADIYKQTRNQITMAKEELAIP